MKLNEFINLFTDKTIKICVNDINRDTPIYKGVSYGIKRQYKKFEYYKVIGINLDDNSSYDLIIIVCESHEYN